jgi:hypothetical protein
MPLTVRNYRAKMLFFLLPFLFFFKMIVLVDVGVNVAYLRLF